MSSTADFTPQAALPGVSRRGGLQDVLATVLAPLRRLVWPLAALALLLLFNLFFTDGFFHIAVRNGRFYGSLIDVLNRGAPVMLLAVGMTLVIATGGIDLSVGAVMAITGTIAACLVARPPWSPLAGIDVGGSLTLVLALSLAVALVAGLGNGLLVTAIGLQPIVATLVLMVAGRGIAQLLTDGQIVTFDHPGLTAFAGGVKLGLPLPVWIAAAVAVAMAIVCRGSALGLFLESVGNNPQTARMVGIHSGLIKIMAYVACALCAGIAGLIATADIRAADVNNVGLYMELDAILAVSLGGTALAGGRFSIAGSLIGAILIQTLTSTVLTHGVPPAMTLVIKGAIVVGVCLLQSERFRRALAGAFAGIARRKAGAR